MEKLKSYFTAICIEILADMTVRMLFDKLRARKLRERLLNYLSRRSNHRKLALTKKQIIELGIVEVADSNLISKNTRNWIVDRIAEYHCIYRRNTKDPIFFTRLSVDIEALFVALAPVLEQDIVRRINLIYNNYSLAYFAVLPVPRDSKSRMTTGFEYSLERCLSSRDIPKELFTPAVVRGELGPGAIAQTSESERILVLQPLSMNDSYLDYSVSHINEHSMSKIAEILTLVGTTDQPKSEKKGLPEERVLLKLNLNN
jgi:hypothetical protein